MGTRRAFVVRLDPETLAALDQAADAARLSREGYVRWLIESQLAPHGHRHKSRKQGSTGERFTAGSADRRVRRGRGEEGSEPNETPTDRPPDAKTPPRGGKSPPRRRPKTPGEGGRGHP
jgi:hypothetical protein